MWRCSGVDRPLNAGYSRKGAALYGLQRFDDAIAAYEAGLAIDPANDQLKSGLEDVTAAAQRANSGRAHGVGPTLAALHSTGRPPCALAIPYLKACSLFRP